MFPGQIMRFLRDGTLSYSITFLAPGLLPQVHKRTQAKLSPLLRIALLLRTHTAPPQLGQNGGRGERRGNDAARPLPSSPSARARRRSLRSICAAPPSPGRPASFPDGHCTVGGVESGLETGVRVRRSRRVTRSPPAPLRAKACVRRTPAHAQCWRETTWVRARGGGLDCRVTQ